jgi:hypothetical protein
MDDIDRADLEAMNFLEAAIAAARGIPASQMPPAAANAMRSCTDCGETIPSERLAVVPATRLCRDCAGRREQGNSQFKRRGPDRSPALPGGYPELHEEDDASEPVRSGESRVDRITASLGLG